MARHADTCHPLPPTSKVNSREATIFLATSKVNPREVVVVLVVVVVVVSSSSSSSKSRSGSTQPSSSSARMASCAEANSLCED